MANKHATLTSLFTAIADAIRAKTGSTETIIADDFPDTIAGIETGSKDTKLTIDHSGDYSLKVYHRPFNSTAYKQTTVGYGDSTTFTLSDGWFVVIVANTALYMCSQTETGKDSSIKYSSSNLTGTNCKVTYEYVLP